MNQDAQLKQIKQYVKDLFHSDATGHDYFHMQRVADMARQLAREENANVFICEAAGWIHDIGDQKLFEDPEQALTEMNEFLYAIGISKEVLQQIQRASKDVSFSQGKVPRTLEGKIVQDADRIDALGAIGIARTFAFGGVNGQAIFHDTHKQNTTIQHFYDKLLLLKDTIHTSTAKEIANGRHVFIEKYLEQFLKEWNTNI